MTTLRMWVSVPSTKLDAESEALIARGEVKGVTLFGGHPSLSHICNNIESPTQLKALIDSMRAIAPGLCVAIDHEGVPLDTSSYAINRFKYLCSDELSDEDNDTLQKLRVMKLPREYSKEGGLGIEQFKVDCRVTFKALLGLGIDTIWGPCIDIHCSESEVIGGINRSFGDSGEIEVYATAFCEIAGEEGIQVSFKHYPGHGYVVEDSHAGLPLDRRTDEQLKEEMGLYDRLLQKFPQAYVMLAHIDSPKLTEEEGLPTSLSTRVRHLLLSNARVVTDCLSMGALDKWSVSDRIKLAHEAGNEVMFNHLPPAMLLDLICERESGQSSSSDSSSLQPQVTSIL